MITGDEIRRARQRAGWSQEELAKRVGTTLRTVGNWERGDTSPSQREAVLRQALEGFWDDDRTHSVSLASASDVELLGEIARRLGRSSSLQEEVGRHGDAAPNRQAAGSAATEKGHYDADAPDGKWGHPDPEETARALRDYNRRVRDASRRRNEQAQDDYDLAADESLHEGDHGEIGPDDIEHST